MVSIENPSEQDRGIQERDSYVYTNMHLSSCRGQGKIPAELQAQNQWVAWKAVPDYDKDMNLKPKPRKVPVNVHSGQGAQANNPGTWAFFNDVMGFIDEWTGYDHTHIDGTGVEVTGTVSGYPGYFFATNDPFCGIDLDDCRNPDTGEVTSWALEIIKHFNSYTELSQSLTGFHIIIKGQKPAGSKSRKGGIECYDRDRYFICTGEVVEGRDIIQDRQTELVSFLDEHLSSKTKPAPLNGKMPGVNQTGVDAQMVLGRAQRSKKNKTIQLLLDGDNAGQPSDSEADLVLCNYLVFFCGYIPDTDIFKIVDSIIQNSKRMRPKWGKVHRPADGATYGQMTIETAIAGTTKRYQIPAKRVISSTQDVAALLTRIGKTFDDVINHANDGQAGCRGLFIDVNRGRFCFDHAAGLWHEFRGHAWKLENLQKVIDECSIIKRIFERTDAELGGRIIDLGQDMKNTKNPADCSVIEAKVDQAKNRQKVLRGVVKSLNTLHFRKQVVEFAAVGDNSLGINGDEWDRMPWHLACNNGVLDLKTGMLRDGKPEDYLKSSCPTGFDIAAHCPQFEQMIWDIFGGSDELISFIQRVFGLSLIGVNVEHKLFVLWGKGRNGKDTLLKALKNSLGDDLAGEIRSEMLLDQGRIKSSSGPSADIMRLRGLRLTWASETNEGRRMDAGQVKLLTGGGDLVGRPPYGRREVSFPQSFTLCLLTNSKPQAPADDYALWRRICLIPFNTRFVDDPTGPNEKLIDRFLDDKLIAEAPGILSWLVQGCLNWQRDGLQTPDMVTQATSEYQADEDILQQFIDDTCIVHKDESCKAGLLYEHYKKWMTEKGLIPISGTKFGRNMKEKFEKSKSSGNRYSGIGIVSTDND